MLNMKRYLQSTLLIFALLSFVACDSGDDVAEELFTGNELNLTLIPAQVQGLSTSGSLVIRERTDGRAQLEITLDGVVRGAVHPVHLHFGDLTENGLVATFLTEIREENGVGKSSTLLTQLDDGTQITYSNLLNFDGSIKIHFESTGVLKDEVLGSVNIGINTAGNAAFMNGTAQIASCNSDFEGK